MTDLETLLPFVHAINPFDAELSNIRVAILPSTDIGLFWVWQYSEARGDSSST